MHGRIEAFVPGGDLPVASNRYHDRKFDIETVKLMPGEYWVTSENMLLVTVTGSCIVTCIRDTHACVGGMNHFMIADGESDSGGIPEAARHGAQSMVQLIDGLIAQGARRDRLEAKVFGAGSPTPALARPSIAMRNAEFAVRFLARQQIEVAAQSLGGEFPRKVYFFPRTGRTLVKTLREIRNETVSKREAEYRGRVDDASKAASMRAA